MLGLLAHCVSILGERQRAAYLYSQVIKGFDLFHHLAFEAQGYGEWGGGERSQQLSSLALLSVRISMYQWYVLKKHNCKAVLRPKILMQWH